MNFESTWIERFYSHFLGRDLSYTFAGGLFICIVEYVLYATVFLPQKLSLELIGFLLASYFLGSVFDDLALEIFPCLTVKKADGYSELNFYQDFIKNYDNIIHDRYERYVCRLKIHTSVGTSSLLSGGLMLIAAIYRWFFQATPASINYIGLTFVLLLLGTFMVYIGKGLAKFVLAEEKAIVVDIKSRNKK